MPVRGSPLHMLYDNCKGQHRWHIGMMDFRTLAAEHNVAPIFPFEIIRLGAKDRTQNGRRLSI